MEGTAGDCKAKVEVKVFFDPVVSIGTEPAWFKYWQGGAIPGLSQFTYVDSFSNSSAWGKYTSTVNPWLQSFFVFDCLPSAESLEIAKASHAVSVTTPIRGIVISGKPLKVVASVVEHELDHKTRRWQSCQQVQTLWDTWWSSLSVVSKAAWIAKGTTEGNKKVASFWAMVDSDRDNVLNGTDPTFDLNSGYDDEYAAEGAMSGGSRVILEDWSKGGEQW